jgi:hypothetical protein
MKCRIIGNHVVISKETLKELKDHYHEMGNDKGNHDFLSGYYIGKRDIMTELLSEFGDDK